MELKEPKRKRGVRVPQSQQFPVLIESETGITACNSLWPTFIGTFNGDCVVVTTKDEIVSLYSMGFFGKGSLSKSYPNFGDVKNGVPPLITERQWKRRKLWVDQLLSFTCPTAPENRKANETLLPENEDNCAKEPEENDLDDDLEIIEDEPNKCSDTKKMNVKSSCKKSIVQIDNENDSTELCQPSCSKQTNSENDRSFSALVTKNIVLDSSCEEETNSTAVLDFQKDQDDDNSVIVINDIDTDDEYQPESIQPRLCNESVKTVVETLNLLLEEAFFLSFGFGCLHVIDLQGMYLSLQDMWLTYRESQPNFVSSYVTYHYFRSKGWVVKPGTKFGGDFLLYKKGPPFYHASYVVLIDEENNTFENMKVKRQLTWTKILGQNRMVESANKEVLISQVIWPQNIKIEELDDPRVVKKFKVREVLMRRWNSSQEREGKDT